MPNPNPNPNPNPTPNQVFERLLLPRFGAQPNPNSNPNPNPSHTPDPNLTPGAQPAAVQCAQRAHLLRHWEAGPSPFSQHTGLCAALRATAFVPVGAERRLCTPAEVLDPYPSPSPYPYP